MGEVGEGLAWVHLDTRVRFLPEKVARNDSERPAEAAGVPVPHRAALRHTRSHDLATSK